MFDAINPASGPVAKDFTLPISRRPGAGSRYCTTRRACALPPQGSRGTEMNCSSEEPGGSAAGTESRNRPAAARPGFLRRLCRRVPALRTAAAGLVLAAAALALPTLAQAQTTMVSIASGGDVAAEGDDATFTLTFSPAAPAGGLTVNVSVAEVQQRTLETGELPYDFVDAANEGMKTVDVTAGATSATLTVPTVDDELYEAEAGADNLLTATLATGTGYAVASGSDSAELTLMDGADRPVLAWKTDKVTVTEGVDDYAEVVLTLSHPLVQEAVFFIIELPGTALLDSDYTFSSNGYIKFAPGATEATEQFGIVDRPLLEVKETFQVQFYRDNAPMVTLAIDRTITVEILDTDTMQVSPSAVSARVVEGDAISIKIDTLPSGDCLSAATFFVTVTPSGDTATLTDANAVEQRFGSCITTQTVSFATREDTTVTANRALSFTLATKAGTDTRITVTDDNVVAVTVIDDDRHATGAPTITGTAQVGETLTAVTTGIADADGLTSPTYTYQWLWANGTEADISSANSSTYTLVNADLGKTIKVRVSFDDDAGFTETLTSAATATVTVTAASTMVSIASGGDVTAEGDDATFTLTFSPAAPAGGLTVNVSVAEVRQRTLESGELPYDFVDAANEGMKTVDVTAGATSATLTVPTVDDELYEAEAGADNLLTATLATGTGYAVASGSDSAELTLMDGADRPVLAWKTDKVTVTEGVDDNAEVVLTLSHPLVEEARFNLLTVAASAQPDSDYTNPADNQNITFAPGATEATDRVGIEDLPLLEGTETFEVRVFNDAAVPVTLASDSTITVEILDADTMQLSPSAVSARVVEGDAIRIKIDTLPSGSCLFAETFFVTVTPSGDTATLTDAAAVEQRFGQCDTTRTVSFATNVDTDVTANRALSFTVATKAGTDARITVTDDNVVEVAVIDDDRHATGAPTITGTAQVNQVLTASPGSIADGDGLAGAAYTYTWIRVDGSDETPITGTTGNSYTVVAADQGNTLKVKASFTDDAGFGEERTSAPTPTVTGLNSAPVFSQTAQARSIAENTAAGVDIGAAVTATDAGDTLTYTLGGAGMASFDIVAATGQIRTKSGITYDHEATPSYTVTVTATDTSNATAVASVTISITDEDEPPDAPAQPTVNAVSGSTTSLAVSWVAPANAGKPDIDSYDVQYRVSGAAAVWSDGGLDVAGTSTTITSLAADTPYDVQVRATNAEGDSDWSDPPGSGRTNAPDNTAPTAADNTVTTRVGTAYTFEADDFGFTDTDAGDTLASVKIVTLPTPGTLALDGTAVVADAVVTKADIDDDKLIFTPVAGASGDPYASFTFKVNDGTDDSASAYTMTIDARDLTCGVPDFAGDDRRELWTGIVTVGDVRSVGYGFHSEESQTGLDDTTFAIGRNSYTIDHAFVLSVNPVGQLGFSLTGDIQNDNLTAGEVAALRLHVCDTVFYDFSAANSSGNENTYRWAGSLDWSPPVATRTLYLSLPANHDAMGAPTITGTARAGQELSADVTGVTDADGLTGDLSTLIDNLDGLGGVEYSYQWIRVDDDGTSNPADITGENAATYTLTDDDEGKKVKVKVSFTDDLNGDEEVLSAAYPSSGTVMASTDDDVIPVLSTATVDGTSLVLTYGEDLDPGSVPVAGDFAVSVAGLTAVVSSVAVSGTTVTLTLANAVAPGQTVTLDYTVPTGTSAMPLQNLAGHDAGPLTSQTVINNSLSAPGALGRPRTLDAAVGDGRVTLAWTAPGSDGGAAIEKYRYRVSADGGLNWDPDWTDVPDGADAGDSAADETTFAVSGLINGTAYVFQLRAVNSVGEGPAARAATTPVRVPLPPGSGFLVGNFGQPADAASQIYVTHDIVGVFTTGARGADLHNIEFRLFSRLPDSAQLPSATLYRASVTDSRATRGARVAALTAVPGSPRPAATAQTVAFTAPGGTRLEAGATYLVLLEEHSYVRAESTTYPAEDGGGASGWAIDGIGAGNSSPYSYETTASLLMRVNGTAAGAPVATAPDAPASLGAAAGAARVNLIWTAPRRDGGAGIEKYQYRYSAGSRVDPDTAWTDVPDGSDSGTSLADERSVSVTELDNGRPYAFELRAVNGVRAGTAATATATPEAPPRFGFLVSNFGQPADGAAQIYVTKDIVGVFTTGARGATLDSIELQLNSRTPGIAQRPSATLYRGSVTDTRATPGTRVATLTAASGSPRPAASAQTITFTAPGGTRLEAGATYMVVLEASSGYVGVQYTNASAQDAGGASGWTIDGVGAGNSSPWSYGTSDSLLMSVNGTAAATARQAVRPAAAKDEQQQEEEVQEPATSPDPDRGISLSTSSSSAIEGQAVTISVRRAGPTDRTTSVAVQVFDSALTGAWPIDLDLSSGVATATATVAIPFDGARPASRTVTVRLASVEEPYSVGSPSTLTFNVTDRDAGLSVDDASVSEGPGATLAFAVTLDRTRDREVTVKYATSDDTATQGDDYTGVSGTLRFAAGETTKTVSVAVLDDAHDEGSETLTLTLSSPRRAVIDDATAVGTIVNSDPLPKGWLARFGRTSATQVLGLLDARFDEARAPASQLTLGGHPINLSGPGGNPQGGADPAGGPAAPLTPGGDSRGTADVGIGPAATHADRTAVPHSAGGPAAMLADPLATSDLAGGPAVAPADPFDALASRYTLDAAARGMADLNNDPAAMHANPSAAPASAAGAGGEATLLERLAWRLLTRGGWSVDRRQFLSGSSFDLSLSALGRETDGEAIETARVRETPGHWSLWGRGALTRFAGQDTGISLDGDVLTGLLGLDYSRGRWLAGLGLAYNDGDGAYRAPDSGTAGKLDSTLVSVHPYLHYALTDRLSAWGTLGYGAGGLRLRPDGTGRRHRILLKPT